MQEIKLVDLQDIALPNWLPNTYIQGLADLIRDTGFVPPIIVLDEELITPDVVAALRTLKARNESPGVAVPFIPAGVAVRDGHWLVSVDRRVAKTITKVEHHTIYRDRWYDYLRPSPIWTVSYHNYANSFSSGGSSGAGIMSWNSTNPLLPSGSTSGAQPVSITTTSNSVTS